MEEQGGEQSPSGEEMFNLLFSRDRILRAEEKRATIVSSVRVS